jgi:imidazolonepropionase-like amidohydrolase
MTTNVFIQIARLSQTVAVAFTFVAGASLARAESLLLTGAIVHTVSGETISPGQVLVSDGKIAGVGAKVNAAGAQVVDLQGLHLFPGLILPTSSLGLVEIGSVRATMDTTEVGGWTPDVKAWLAVNPDSELIPVARAAGITHFVATPSGNGVSGQSGVMAMAGWGNEGMTVKKPAALHLSWPSMALTLSQRGGGRAGKAAEGSGKSKSLDEQNKDRQRKVKDLDDFFEEARAYAKSRPTGKGSVADAGFNPAWEGMLPLVRGEVPLVVHADDVRQIKAAVAWAGARQYRIVIAGGRDAWMAAELLAEKRVPVIYESTFDQPAHDSNGYDAQYRAAAVLNRAGVRVLFSEGLGARAATMARNLPHHAAQAVAFGLPEAEALKAITLYPAEVFGIADRLGSIETGKEASLIAVDGNVLDLRTNVKRMWIAGREVSLDSRHTRLYEKYRARPLPGATP